MDSPHQGSASGCPCSFLPAKVKFLLLPRHFPMSRVRKGLVSRQTRSSPVSYLGYITQHLAHSRCPMCACLWKAELKLALLPAYLLQPPFLLIRSLGDKHPLCSQDPFLWLCKYPLPLLAFHPFGVTKGLCSQKHCLLDSGEFLEWAGTSTEKEKGELWVKAEESRGRSKRAWTGSGVGRAGRETNEAPPGVS